MTGTDFFSDYGVADEKSCEKNSYDLVVVATFVAT
jgi:hypothetical protein